MIDSAGLQEMWNRDSSLIFNEFEHRCSLIITPRNFKDGLVLLRISSLTRLDLIAQEGVKIGPLKKQDCSS